MGQGPRNNLQNVDRMRTIKTFAPCSAASCYGTTVTLNYATIHSPTSWKLSTSIKQLSTQHHGVVRTTQSFVSDPLADRTPFRCVVSHSHIKREGMGDFRVSHFCRATVTN